ncbi:MAG TPA: hypothetical protein PKD15_06150 [Candidatus Saccharibacteria bacterium]|jgi:hypothetical protein|nr:hypothetical protein [Candidatus Saccharibacteria bacterium]
MNEAAKNLEVLAISPEAQLPRLESVVGHEVVVTGSTPTRTGNWIGALLVAPK